MVVVRYASRLAAGKHGERPISLPFYDAVAEALATSA
jgi:hypothetical protein